MSESSDAARRRFPFPQSPLVPPETENERWLYGLTRFGMKPGLENIELLVDHFGHPEKDLRFLHVAGTNGKGSVCHFLDSLLRAGDWKTGLFTSPHLLHVTERFRVGGVPIPEDCLAELLSLVAEPVQELEATFFETITLIALLHFQAEGVEWVLWETGLGGRLDCTRIVKPEACLLSSLARDHTRYLGKTLEEIALEKLAIGVAGKPFYCALEDGPLLDLARVEARTKGFEMRELNRLMPWRLEEDRLVVEPVFKSVPPGGFALSDADCATVETVTRKLANSYELPGLPQVQARNAALALLCLAELGERRGEALLPEDPAAAVAATPMPGRFHVIQHEPLLVLDGAHNPVALQCSLDAFERLFNRDLSDPTPSPSDCTRVQNMPSAASGAPAEPVIIFGCMEDKETEEMIQILARSKRRIIFTTARQGRSLAPDHFTKHPLAEDKSWETSENLGAALQRAGESSSILLTGSFYLAAEAYHLCGIDPFYID